MWKDLTMSQRADMMDLYLSKGITSLDDMRSLYDSSISDTAQGTSFSNGGSIHIKPENRGKFTALKERTGHSATWFKEHGTPAQKKMATFALNARHWKHGYGGHIYDGTTEDTQQMNIPYAGELPDVTVMPRRIANKAWDKVQERWVGDMPTYYAVNPDTGKEEMLREIGNGKYSTYDDKHVFDVLGAEAAKKQREQWIKNGGNASDFDKVMLGTLGLGLAPIALPEAATGIWAASQTPAGQTLLAGTLGGEAWEALNHGITGQSWGDNLGDVIGLDKDNYLGRTALGLTNPFYGLSPNMIYRGGEAVLGAGKEVGKAINTAVENFRYPLGKPQVPEDYITLKPQIRTRVGDVEVDNPNLLYHLDRGDGIGAFNNQGAYVEDGLLFPGTPKDISATPYSWWNEGKPYSTSVNGQPMTRLMTTTKDTPGMIHVRSQNYPIGQWDGKRGFVLNSEYVNPEKVNISGSTYTLDPSYGWRKVSAEDIPTIYWDKIGNRITYYSVL